MKCPICERTKIISVIDILSYTKRQFSNGIVGRPQEKVCLNKCVELQEKT